MQPGADSTAEWLTAIGTCAAVVVALFGPSIRNWWKRPRLSLQHEPGLEGDELIFAEGDRSEDYSRVSIITLVVTNHGRGQAADVEAILTARQRFGPDPEGAPDIPEFELPVVSRGALRWELGHPEDNRINIPPRSSRTLQLAILGTDARIRQELADRDEEAPLKPHEVNGVFCVRPVKHSDMYTALPSDEPIGIEIQLQGHNVRATTWVARIKAWPWGFSDGDASLSGVSLTWIANLRKGDHHILPSPIRARISYHMPWAYWSRYRFNKELDRLKVDTTDE